MKPALFATAFLAASAVAFAQEPPAPAPGAPPAAAPQADRPGKEMSLQHRVEIVSVDAAAKSITVTKAAVEPPSKPTTGGSVPSTDKGPSVTLKVDDAAVSSLSTLKAGDVVTITCSRSVGPDTGMSGEPGRTASGTTKEPTGGRSLQQCDRVTIITKS